MKTANNAAQRELLHGRWCGDIKVTVETSFEAKQKGLKYCAVNLLLMRSMIKFMGHYLN
jgi:hypothetical protein